MFKVHLFDLPDEVLLDIISYQDVKGMNVCAKVNISYFIFLLRGRVDAFFVQDVSSFKEKEKVY